VLNILSGNLEILENHIPAHSELRACTDTAWHDAALDRRALCSQCGFASSFPTDRFPNDDAERKRAHLGAVPAKSGADWSAARKLRLPIDFP
jgi:ribosomal protein L37E